MSESVFDELDAFLNGSENLRLTNDDGFWNYDQCGSPSLDNAPSFCPGQESSQQPLSVADWNQNGAFNDQHEPSTGNLDCRQADENVETRRSQENSNSTPEEPLSSTLGAIDNARHVPLDQTLPNARAAHFSHPPSAEQHPATTAFQGQKNLCFPLEMNPYSTNDPTMGQNTFTKTNTDGFPAGNRACYWDNLIQALGVPGVASQDNVLSSIPPATFTPPTYTADENLKTPQQCREYLAYLDPGEKRIVHIPGDDWEHVKRNYREQWAAEFFNSLFVHNEMTQEVASKMRESIHPCYIKQQADALSKIQSLVQGPIRLKQATARCNLLFDAAISVHEWGFPKEIYQRRMRKIEAGRKPDRKATLNAESICSVRLKKMVYAIRKNKLVGLDVLSGQNLPIFARDPDAYLSKKITSLKTNGIRQGNLKRLRDFDPETPDAENTSVSHDATRGSKRQRLANDDEWE